MRFTACANPYDIVRLPGFEFGISHPEHVYREALATRFPREPAAIAGWFAACEPARQSASTLFALHGMPAWMAWGLRLWRGAEAERWARHTVADELAKIDDALLRAVLGARWADHGARRAHRHFADVFMVAAAVVVHRLGTSACFGHPSRIGRTWGWQG